MDYSALYDKPIGRRGAGKDQNIDDRHLIMQYGQDAPYTA
jgi:hypothetical protein